jgi:hypothetical protein
MIWTIPARLWVGVSTLHDEKLQPDLARVDPVPKTWEK